MLKTPYAFTDRQGMDLAALGVICLLLWPLPAWGDGAGCAGATERSRLRLLCFLDATAFVSTGGEEDSASGGFSGGEFDLILVSELGRRWVFLADLSVVGERTSPRESAPSEVDAALERAFLRYDYRDSLRLSVGQFHTPISRWNDDYHRARWLHVAASRPRMVELDGRFLPGHLLGVMAGGSFVAGGLNLDYRVGVGDGRPGLTSGDVAPDPESDGAAVLSVGIEPAKMRGFRAGATAYSERLTLDAPAREVDEDIVAVHLAWTRGINRIIGEFAQVRHRDTATGARFDSQAFYLEIVYRLRSFRRRMAIYNRIEELRVAADDPVLRVIGGRAAIIGLRFDLLEQVALKAELREDSARDLASTTGLFLQTSLVF